MIDRAEYLRRRGWSRTVEGWADGEVGHPLHEGDAERIQLERDEWVLYVVDRHAEDAAKRRAAGLEVAESPPTRFPLCAYGCCFECANCAVKPGAARLCDDCLRRRRECRGGAAEAPSMPVLVAEVRAMMQSAVQDKVRVPVNLDDCAYAVVAHVLKSELMANLKRSDPVRVAVDRPLEEMMRASASQASSFTLVEPPQEVDASRQPRCGWERLKHGEKEQCTFRKGHGGEHNYDLPEAVKRKAEIDERLRQLRLRIAEAKSKAWEKKVFMPAAQFRALEREMVDLKSESQTLQARLVILKQSAKEESRATQVEHAEHFIKRLKAAVRERFGDEVCGQLIAQAGEREELAEADE